MKHLHFALILALLLLLWPLSAGAQPARFMAERVGVNMLAGELIVKLRPGAALDGAAHVLGPRASGLAALLHHAGAGVARSLGPGSDTYRIRVSDNTDIAT